MNVLNAVYLEGVGDITRNETVCLTSVYILN
jgi:hypothetical protein